MGADTDVAPPVFWLLAGPNGSGKSTYYDLFVAQVFKAPFINADRIAHELLGRHPRDDREMALATREAEKQRAECLAQRRSFVAETVFSHRSKLDLMHTAIKRGFHVRMSFVCISDPALCALRVQGRVAEGGHGVPVEKIVARYERSLGNAREAVLLAHWAVVLDNTSIDQPHRQMLHYEAGELRSQALHLPAWAKSFPRVKRTHR